VEKKTLHFFCDLTRVPRSESSDVLGGVGGVESAVLDLTRHRSPELQFTKHRNKVNGFSLVESHDTEDPHARRGLMRGASQHLIRIMNLHRIT
jgi:hypothetical protein